MFPPTSRLPRPTAEAGCEPSGSSRSFSSDVFLSRSFLLLSSQWWRKFLPPAVCVWSWARHSCANGRSDLDYGYVQAGALSSSKKIVLELRLPCLIGSLPLVCRQRTWACRQQQRCYTARNSLSASSIVFRRFWVLIRRLVQSLLANDDPYPNIQGLLITSSHQSRSMCRLLYPLTKCNCLKI